MAEILMTRWLYERKNIDFILCIGDGLSDEEMFISIKNRIKERPCDFPVNFLNFFNKYDFFRKILSLIIA